MTISRIAAAALLAAASLFTLPAAHAQQQGPGWFVPSQPQAQSRAPAAPRQPATRPAPRPEPSEPIGPVAGGPEPGDQAPDQPAPQIPAPPIPTLPALPKTAGPPAVVVGVLGVPEVMRASTAAQEVEKVVGARRDKLAQDAQKEQAAWRDLSQQLAGQRTKLSQDQLRQKERELQERVTNAQRQFRDRNRIIQAAAQYSLGQIESTLIAVIRQVAESRGMNLVLHRSQVALNINEFDITDQVAAQLNKILPNVQIPAENVDPATLVKQQAGAQASGPAVQNTPSNGPSAVLPAPAAAGAPAVPVPPAPPAPHAR